MLRSGVYIRHAGGRRFKSYTAHWLQKACVSHRVAGFHFFRLFIARTRDFTSFAFRFVRIRAAVCSNSLHLILHHMHRILHSLFSILNNCQFRCSTQIRFGYLCIMLHCHCWTIAYPLADCFNITIRQFK